MNEITINELKMYSPLQVFLGSLFFGPLSMVFFLWKNFKTMGNSVGAKYTLIFGALFVLLLLLGFQLAPPNINPIIPNIIIPFIYALAALQMTNSWQMDKEAIADSMNYNAQSYWRVVVYGLPLYLVWYAMTVAIQLF